MTSVGLNYPRQLKGRSGGGKVSADTLYQVGTGNLSPAACEIRKDGHVLTRAEFDAMTYKQVCQLIDTNVQAERSAS